MDELIEKIAKELAWKYGTRNEVDRYDGIVADLVLAVVLADIKEKPEKYVEICPDAGCLLNQCHAGQLEYACMGEIHYKDCQTCQGKGIVAVEVK
jgi:hypothetical protein